MKVLWKELTSPWTGSQGSNTSCPDDGLLQQHARILRDNGSLMDLVNSGVAGRGI